GRVVDLLGSQLQVQRGAHQLVEAGGQPGGDGPQPADAQTGGVAGEAGDVLELVHGQHQLGVVDEAVRDGPGRRVRVGGEGGDVLWQAGVGRAVLDQRRQRALV